MKKTINSLATTFLLLATAPTLILLSTTLRAQEPTTSAQAESKPQQPDNSQDVKEGETPGIAIGEALPTITLPKQDGSEVSIQDLAKKGPVAMVFYRSASW